MTSVSMVRWDFRFTGDDSCKWEVAVSDAIVEKNIRNVQAMSASR